MIKFDAFKTKLTQEKKKRKGFPINLTDDRDPKKGTNFFHYLIGLKDVSILQKFHSNYMKYAYSFEDIDQRNKLLELYLLLIEDRKSPSKKVKDPFSLAIEQSPQFADTVLEMLN
jgi:hypothetical protein